MISTRSNLELFHPFCKPNSVINWQEDKTINKIENLNGFKLTREFYNWVTNRGYDLYIKACNKPAFHVFWRIIENNTKFNVKIIIHSYLFNQGNKIINLLPSYLMVRPLLLQYLFSVLSGLKWYAKKDRSILKNHFGKHIWFS